MVGNMVESPRFVALRRLIRFFRRMVYFGVASVCLGGLWLTLASATNSSASGAAVGTVALSAIGLVLILSGIRGARKGKAALERLESGSA